MVTIFALLEKNHYRMIQLPKAEELPLLLQIQSLKLANSYKLSEELYKKGAFKEVLVNAKLSILFLFFFSPFNFNFI